MTCHDNPRKSDCGIHNWCVCQWAFARYIEKAGGCDQIQDVVCESINILALKSYQQHSEHYGAALQCLVKRCDLNATSTSTGSETDEKEESFKDEHSEL